ncbi:hypothetical protein [Saccharomonospora viridis]|uniref:hypothetical protein n=1 Tax=Saccharomonospora viridis TaxID=1852 RepID=UPI00240A9A38|nr:hypothetical protein [Saccharomonospora viridis]
MSGNDTRVPYLLLTPLYPDPVVVTADSPQAAVDKFRQLTETPDVSAVFVQVAADSWK